MFCGLVHTKLSKTLFAIFSRCKGNNLFHTCQVLKCHKLYVMLQVYNSIPQMYLIFTFFSLNYLIKRQKKKEKEGTKP